MMSPIWGKSAAYVLVTLCLCVGIGFLYTKNRDVALIVVVVAVYLGLFSLLRKTKRPKHKGGYPVIRYRGHPVRKRNFRQ